MSIFEYKHVCTGGSTCAWVNIYVNVGTPPAHMNTQTYTYTQKKKKKKTNKTELSPSPH